MGSPQEQDGKGTVTLNGNSMLFADDILDEFKKKMGSGSQKIRLKCIRRSLLPILWKSAAAGSW